MSSWIFSLSCQKVKIVFVKNLAGLLIGTWILTVCTVPASQSSELRIFNLYFLQKDNTTSTKGYKLSPVVRLGKSGMQFAAITSGSPLSWNSRTFYDLFNGLKRSVRKLFALDRNTWNHVIWSWNCLAWFGFFVLMVYQTLQVV